MHPTIGLIPLEDIQRESLWMLPGYMNGIVEAGGLPLMLPLTNDKTLIRQIAEQLDGFLLTGGQDVSPSVYGAPVSPNCGETSPKRDEMELLLLEEVLRRGKPVFGICRGIQFLNAALGGTLYQDLPTEHPSGISHAMKPPYHLPKHTVEILHNTPLHALLAIDTLPVNSYHHQAVKTLSPKLEPMAVSPDGLIEAAWMPAADFVWAVQWHPEFSHITDEHSRKLLKAFVDACR
jgi:putative glutamine amidotransferase